MCVGSLSWVILGGEKPHWVEYGVKQLILQCSSPSQFSPRTKQTKHLIRLTVRHSSAECLCSRGHIVGNSADKTDRRIPKQRTVTGSRYVITLSLRCKCSLFSYHIKSSMLFSKASNKYVRWFTLLCCIYDKMNHCWPLYFFDKL